MCGEGKIVIHLSCNKFVRQEQHANAPPLILDFSVCCNCNCDMETIVHLFLLFVTVAQVLI